MPFLRTICKLEVFTRLAIFPPVTSVGKIASGMRFYTNLADCSIWLGEAKRGWRALWLAKSTLSVRTVVSSLNCIMYASLLDLISISNVVIRKSISFRNSSSFSRKQPNSVQISSVWFAYKFDNFLLSLADTSINSLSSASAHASTVPNNIVTLSPPSHVNTE